MSAIWAQQRSFRPWIIAIVATVAIIAATLLGLRTFNSRAQAEGENPPESSQSDTTTLSNTQSNNEQSGSSQSGDSTSNDSQSGDMTTSDQPVPISIPSPTPPPNLDAGGLISAQATSQWYLDLWTYAFNTGDTEEFMKLCHAEPFCTQFENDMRIFHSERTVISPSVSKYLMTQQVYDCTDPAHPVNAACIMFRYSSTSLITRLKDADTASSDFSTISVFNDRRDETSQYECKMRLEAEGDVWVVKIVHTHLL